MKHLDAYACFLAEHAYDWQRFRGDLIPMRSDSSIATPQPNTL